MKRCIFSFVGDMSDLAQALVPFTFEREREDDEIIEFLEDLAGDASYVPVHLEPQLG